MNKYEPAVIVSNYNHNGNVYETIEAIRSSGFKNVFVEWYNEPWSITQEEQLKYMQDVGLNIIFAHLGYKKINDIWVDGDSLLEDYKNDIRICKENNISTVIMHLIGGKVMPPYNEKGLRRIQELADYAEELDVNIAIENTKRKEYLYYVIDNIKNKNVGVCFDSGHFHVFSDDNLDWTKLKDRVFAIHLHDNDQSGDLHLLPFDGTLNWDDVVMKLIESNYTGPVTLEIRYHRDYINMPIEEFYKKGYEISLRLKSMFEEKSESHNMSKVLRRKD